MKQSHFNFQQIDPPDRCTANIHPTPVSVSSWQTFHHCKPLALAGRTFALLLNHRRYRVLPLHVVNPISFRSILWRNNVGWQQQKKVAPRTTSCFTFCFRCLSILKQHRREAILLSKKAHPPAESRGKRITTSFFAPAHILCHDFSKHSSIPRKQQSFHRHRARMTRRVRKTL